MAGNEGWASIIPESEPPEIDVTVAHPRPIPAYCAVGRKP